MSTTNITLSDKLRILVEKEHTVLTKSLRRIANELKIHENTLYRFIQGAPCSSKLIDKLYERYIKR